MVNTGPGSAQQAAPGTLEQVRELLNTWLIPNENRRPTDQFSDYAQRQRLAPEDQPVLRQLRDDLRAVVERERSSDQRINAWIGRLNLTVAVTDGELTFRHSGRQAGALLATVLQAITSRQWDRLKACPDCRWVFYDHTRNASKRWCLMNAGGPEGRACGTIAKVRRHRQTRAARNHP